MVACDFFFSFLKGRKSPFYMASFEMRSSVIDVPTLALISLMFFNLDELPQET